MPTASLPAATPPAVLDAPPPMVFVDRRHEPALAVTRYRAAAPLDRRETRLTATPPHDPDAFANRRVVVAQPLRLSDGETRWAVLAAGRPTVERTRSAHGVDENRLLLIDELDRRLDQPLPRVWYRRADGALLPQPATRLCPGAPGNRAADPVDLAGRSAHPLQDGAKPWTVATAVTSLTAFARLDGEPDPTLPRDPGAELGLDLDLTRLPRAIADAPLAGEVDLTRPLGQALAAILEPYALVLRRDRWRDAGRLGQRIAVVPADAASPAPLDAPIERATRPDPEPARQWVALGDRPVVESTFELHPDWDPALADRRDPELGRSTSIDFSRVRRVFRQWSLNEDARLSPAVPPLDLTALLSPPPAAGAADERERAEPDRRIRPQPLPLAPCVTRDAQPGEPVPPVIEFSTDAGATWARWAGQAEVNADHAGVYLDDDQLPPGFLAAARAGAARVRVTAALISPHPIAARRWRGNPFAGAAEPRVFDLGERYPLRRVHPGSIHADAGLPTDAVDARPALRRWLVDRLDLADALGPPSGGARLRLAGARPLLRVGDRLADPPNPGPAIHTVDCDFTDATTTLYA